MANDGKEKKVSKLQLPGPNNLTYTYILPNRNIVDGEEGKGSLKTIQIEKKANGTEERINNNQAFSDNSFAEGNHTIATGASQHVSGEYNKKDLDETAENWSSDKKGTYAQIIGNGTEKMPSNAYTLDWNGNGWYKGTIKVGGESASEGKMLATEEYANNIIGKENEGSFPDKGKENTIYIDYKTDKIYRWDNGYIPLSSNIELGTNEGQAYPGPSGSANAKNIAQINDKVDTNTNNISNINSKVDANATSISNINNTALFKSAAESEDVVETEYTQQVQLINNKLKVRPGVFIGQAGDPIPPGCNIKFTINGTKTYSLLPEIKEGDSGKIAMINNGEWKATSLSNFQLTTFTTGEYTGNDETEKYLEFDKPILLLIINAPSDIDTSCGSALIWYKGLTNAKNINVNSNDQLEGWNQFSISNEGKTLHWKSQKQNDSKTSMNVFNIKYTYFALLYKE